MKKQCPTCNATLEDNFNYCPICGEPITPLAQQREQAKRSNAGYEVLKSLAESTDDMAVSKAILDMLNKQ